MELYIVFGLLSTVLTGCYAGRNEVLTAVGNQLSDVDILCNSNNIEVTVSTSGNDFSGMVYPKGLSKNSSCLVEYEHAGNKITYKLPLRSCNTMSHDITEGVEYFNTIVIQPHSKLVTSLGRGFHVRCRYQTKHNTTLTEVSANHIGTQLKEAVPMPNCGMHIYVGRPDDHVIAEHVRIGDYLTLVISIDHQDTYGFKVTNCLVQDGLSWSEQPLINNDGCPIDPDVMGNFEYSKNLTVAQVTYPAHKFPFTASVYYKCNIKLCFKKQGGCDDVPPICDETGRNVRRRRRKRQSELEDRGSLESLKLQDEDLRDRSVEVHSGLYVNEVDEDDEDRAGDASSLSNRSDDEFCVSTRKFAIGIAIAGVLLTLAVILLVACIVHRRRRRKGTSTTGSSIYSGPYSNHAYSRD